MAKNKRPKLLCLKGLPASGKSTYAKELESKGWGRTNKDDIRKLNFPNYEFKDEKKVIAIENGMIKAHLSAGRNVVVDNTHFNPRHQQRLEAIAKEFNADFEVMFIDTPLEECIKRNRKRTDSVPMEAILNMYRKYIAPYREEHVKYDDMLDEAILVDIDGTLAHIDGDNPRNPYDASRAMEDVLDDAVSVVTSMCYKHGYRVIILTGRHSGHLQVTQDWLAKNGVNYDEIYCRNEGDKRPDYMVKQELFNHHIKNKYNIKFVIDDRPSVCRMWRSLGLRVLQVGDPHVEF